MSRIKKNLYRFVCFCLCVLLFFTSCLISVIAAEINSKVVRVGWYEDSYNMTGENGERSGYNYEYEQAVSGYTGWSYEYVKAGWPELMEMIEKGEIDLMGDVSYTDERAEKMLYSALPMGEEKYYLYVDLVNTDISSSDLSTLNGKRIGLLEDSVQETQFCQWEKENGLQTQHILMTGLQDAMEKVTDHELDCIVSTETPQWPEAGMSAVATTGSSDIYFVINKNRPDLKEEIDNAMRKMEYDKPFYADDLYKKYLSAVSNPVLSSDEQEWLKKHGAIRIGWLNNDSGISVFDKDSGEMAGIINDYIKFAANCMGNHTLDFDLIGFDFPKDQIQALKDGEIDMIFHFSQNPYIAEENGFALSNTVLAYNMAVVTEKTYFNENDSNVVAIEKDNLLYKWYISYNYPKWKIMECNSVKETENAVKKGKADCFLSESGQLTSDINDSKVHSVSLTQPGNTSFAVKRENTILLSILNKTLRTMSSSMLTGALAMYENAQKEFTLTDFIKGNLLTVFITLGSIVLLVLIVILGLLHKAKVAEEKAKNSQIQAENANVAKSNFLFNMSHDIRTPMNAILGFTELAGKNKDNPQILTDYLSKIQMSGKGLLSILDKVLEISRIESGKTVLEESPQEAGKVLETCIVMMNPEIEKKHLSVTLEKEIQNPYVYFDATRITEIILNILSNAVKYTADGGRIDCKLTQSPHPDEDWIYQELFIQDNGIGMSEEFQKHIFDLFAREHSTTTSGIPGTGLGMGITKKLVDLMNGTIIIDSKVGEGTTVVVRIPIRIATLEDTLPKHSKEFTEKERLQGKRILLAEDNDLNAEIAITLLEEEGLNVDRAEDGVECVKKLEYSAPRYYDLILMDIQMPLMNGYQATEKIRKLSDKEKAGIPIIAMTANAFSEDKARAIASGMNDHVAKPIDMDILVATMLKYIKE